MWWPCRSARATAAYGRYAKNQGANVAAILSLQTTSDGELAWGATRVKLEKLGAKRMLPVIENNVGVDAVQRSQAFPGVMKE